MTAGRGIARAGGMVVTVLILALLHFAQWTGTPATLTVAVNRLLSADNEVTMPQFDVAFFKVLAANDTSSAPGHQGGIVVPKDLAYFFPRLPEASPERPTVDVPIRAELWKEGDYLGSVVTRFQHQTWGGSRNPERRLTSNLGAIRDIARAGDILLFQRSLEEDGKVRITLTRQGSSLFVDLWPLLKGRRWGALSDVPATNSQLADGEKAVADSSSAPFRLFKAETERLESRVRRIARERAFRLSVLQNFDMTCAFTGRMMIAPGGAHGLDAAHIVPVSSRGTDDVRNGLAISKELHWAFDRGLVAVRDGRVAVASAIMKDERNAYLQSFSGKLLQGPTLLKASLSPEALNWHYENVFLG